MAERYFTVEEANALLVEVRPLVDEMVRHKVALAQAMERRSALASAVQTNGGGIAPATATDLDAAVAAETEAISRCVERIQELGGVVKDLNAGLVDFPALRDGEVVYLCWRLGEDEIRYWHGLEEGFAGRKELPL